MRFSLLRRHDPTQVSLAHRSERQTSTLQHWPWPYCTRKPLRYRHYCGVPVIIRSESMHPHIPPSHST